MKANEVWFRCQKARIMSWLGSNHVGAIIPTGPDSGIVLAVYHNGRYIEPEVFHVPNSPAEMWGPDGPLYRSQQPPEAPEDPAAPEGGPDESH